MDNIQLLYVENKITRTGEGINQQLVFFMLIENKGYDKHIDVFWSGENGVWTTLSAEYHSMQGDNKEYWQAKISFDLSGKQSLPGNINFSLRYQISGSEYYDNNHDRNYVSEADSGVMLAANQRIQNIGFQSSLQDQQRSIPVTIAVDKYFHANNVTLHWTTDNWQTVHILHCTSDSNYWNTNFSSNARNPNQYGVQLWTGIIENGDSFGIQYSICCENGTESIWENNQGCNYSFQRDQLKVLVLNLHCYQEENQDEKFTLIAKVIDELKVDIVCFQEVAEYWRDGEGDWESNSAKLINDRLSKRFHLHTDWSHIGFDKYKEGVAILSRYPLSDHQSRYVSESHEIYSIHSRKVVVARVHVPYIGAINVFSAHLSWLEDGFQEQFERLHEWAESNDNEHVKATLLCGDFNITAGSEGYQLVVDSNQYDDQYLAANEQGIFDKIFKVNDNHWQDLLADDYRIDYIFMNKDSSLKVTSARVVFTDQDYGPVSDHCGYFMTFEPSTPSI